MGSHPEYASFGGEGTREDDDISEISAESSHAAASSTASPRRKKKFRKAPQAPRRFRSAYILFSISKMAEYKKYKEDNVQVTSFSRQIASDWKALPEEERKQWEEVARKDMLRYNAEKEMYTGPWQVPSGRSRKDPSAPKRPCSAFLFYSQTMRSKLKQENPDLKNTEISKLLGQAWKNAPPEVKQPHIEREHREREVYKERIATWRKKRKEEERIAKQEREALTEHFMNNGVLLATKTSAGTATPLTSALNVSTLGLLPPRSDPSSWAALSSQSTSLVFKTSSPPTAESQNSIRKAKSAKDPQDVSSRAFLNEINLSLPYTESAFQSDEQGPTQSFGYGNQDFSNDEDAPPLSDNPLFPSFFNGDTKYDPPLALLD